MASTYRVATVLAVAAGSSAAVPQAIRPSDQPGREPERFINPLAPRARPGASSVALPCTTAPPQPKTIPIAIRRIQIVDAMVNGPGELKPFYHEPLGHLVPFHAIYDLAQRITAKYH